jgi:hypothetical protein
MYLRWLATMYSLFTVPTYVLDIIPICKEINKYTLS